MKEQRIDDHHIVLVPDPASRPLIIGLPAFDPADAHVILVDSSNDYSPPSGRPHVNGRSRRIFGTYAPRHGRRRL